MITEIINNEKDGRMEYKALVVTDFNYFYEHAEGIKVMFDKMDNKCKVQYEWYINSNRLMDNHDVDIIWGFLIGDLSKEDLAVYKYIREERIAHKVEKARLKKEKNKMRMAKKRNNKKKVL